MQDAQRLINVIRKAIAKEVGTVGLSNYRYGVAGPNSGGAYEVDAYLDGDTEITSYIRQPSGGYLNPGDPIGVVTTPEGDAWVDQVILESMHSKMAMDYNGGKIYVGDGLAAPSDPGLTGFVLHSGGPDDPVYWETGGSGGVAGPQGPPGSTGAQGPPSAAGPMVVLRAAGGTADDAQAFRDAMDAALPGTTFLLPDPLYQFTTQNGDGVFVDIDKPNIRFEGLGRSPAHIGVPGTSGPTTVIRAGGGAGGTMFRWRPVTFDAADDTDMIAGGGLSRLDLQGNANADLCLRISGGVTDVVFEDVWMANALEGACVIGLAPNTVVEAWTFPRHIRFAGCVLRAVNDTPALTLDHGFGMWFQACNFIYSGASGMGIHAISNDDIILYGCSFVSSTPATSYAVVNEGSDDTYSDTVVMFGAWGNNAQRVLNKGTGDDNPSKGTLLLGLSMTDATMRPEWEPGGMLHYVDTMGRHNLRYDLRTAAHWEEDFIGDVADGLIGELHWARAGAGSTVVGVASEANHPGIVRGTTAATTGSHCTVCLLHGTGGTPDRWLLGAEDFYSYFVFRLPATDANTIARVGFSETRVGGTPTGGFYIEKLAADTQWFAVSRAGGTQTRVGTAMGTVTANAWVGLQIHKRADGQVGFSITDAQHWMQAPHVISTNVPSGALFPMFQIETAANAAKTMDVDAFSLNLHGLVR